VTPFGEIVTVEARGLLMGNRGILHDRDRRVVRYAQGRRWIACLLSFRGRQRSVMRPGSYTELFFLDEAVALAAGHRPCAECRHDDYERFRDAWARGVLGAFETGAGRPVDCLDERRRARSASESRSRRPLMSARALPADAIDMRLDADRLIGPRTRRTYRERAAELPDGTYVEIDGTAWLVWERAMLAWSPAGYTERRAPLSGAVTVLTPRCTVDVIRAGYRPAIHPSATPFVSG
jgi:hypothetical protein